MKKKKELKQDKQAKSEARRYEKMDNMVKNQLAHIDAISELLTFIQK